MKFAEQAMMTRPLDPFVVQSEFDSVRKVVVAIGWIAPLWRRG